MFDEVIFFSSWSLHCHRQAGEVGDSSYPVAPFADGLIVNPVMVKAVAALDLRSSLAMEYLGISRSGLQSFV